MTKRVKQRGGSFASEVGHRAFSKPKQLGSLSYSSCTSKVVFHTYSVPPIGLKDFAPWTVCNEQQDLCG